MILPPTQTDETEIPAVDGQTDQAADLIGDTSVADATATPVGDTPSDDGPKSLTEALEQGIEEASKPRKITPKSEETAESKDAARARNADGTFKEETAEEKAAREAAETPEAKAAREAEEAKLVKKEPDAINDPIPEGLNKRTTDRIKSLVETVKAQEHLVAQHDQLFGAVRDTGATPEEFTAMLGYMRSVHTQDPAELNRAYTMLQSEMRGLMVRMGKAIPEVNLLRDESNNDLVDEIRNGTLTAARAHEIAVSREVNNHKNTAATAVTAEATARAENVRLSAEGKSQLDTLGNELQARDGAVYTQKYDVLVPILTPIFKTLHPSQWAATFRAAYDKVKVSVPTLAPEAAPRNMPLRPKTPAGAGSSKTAPTSALDAINAALEG